MWLLMSLATAAEIEVDYGGRVQMDLRLQLDKPYEGLDTYYNPVSLPPSVARNQLLFNNQLTAGSGRFRAVLDTDLILVGYPQQVDDLSGLTQRQFIDTFRIETHSAYLEARDLVKGLDVRLGQQKAMFGVGDQFNPTNTFNPNDVEDVLLFGDQQGQIMARLDYTPMGMTTLTGMLIPVFRPALLPASAPLGPLNVDALPFVEDDLRWRIHAEKAAAEQNFDTPTVVGQVTPLFPEPSLDNLQLGFRLGTWFAGQDVALSYFRGFADVPVAASFTRTSQTLYDEPFCHPDDDPEAEDARCIDGLLTNTVELTYPRIQVIGLNWAGEAFVGYRAEVGLYLPDTVEFEQQNDEIQFLGGLVTTPAGEYEYELDEPYTDSGRPTTLRNQPYLKWTLGLDYTFGKHLYVNAQWVHGMFDEHGGDSLLGGGKNVRAAGVDSDAATTAACAFDRDGSTCAWERWRPKIGDYAVLGADVNFANTNGLLRVFTIWDLTSYTEEHYDPASETRVQTKSGPFSDGNFSAVVFPELAYNFGHGLELGTGVLLQLGPEASKFGAPEAGGSVWWTRGRLYF